MKKAVLDAYNKTKAYYCLDCGKCTSNCPVSHYYEGFSPRLLVKEATAGFDELSRNRQLGERLAAGERARDIVNSQKAVAEGYATAAAVHELASREAVDMPISEGVYRVCHQGADLRAEAARLMSREMKDELAGIFEPARGQPER